jgi:hypothetical protein
MRYYFATLLVLFFFSQPAHTQPAGEFDPAMALATRMKDSLLLTTGQKDSIYTVNLQLNNLRTAAREQYQQQPDSLQHRLQQIEYSRDPLYRPILGVEKFLLYKSKKRALLTAN